ncbi:extracellular solute-binding protein [Ornithinimicrobium sp. F0845]|uniref:extracellular solute-binding protein n=1 Tax=Ornithinimicrobium sp. F0845 TaxID=2926412 RepID=UPI001FF3F232|nr:extracellular solute-binding protein [Ornithinimicrobium sp. F0845]MCK0112433.1 extracellular solute-binding protein [Ornithinimicrobium sp. F0845]
MRAVRFSRVATAVLAAAALSLTACSGDGDTPDEDEAAADDTPSADAGADSESTDDGTDEDAEAGAGADEGPLVIYSGRSEDLVDPLIEAFEEASGLETEVRYAGSAEQAQLLLTEGDNSPAHVFFSQEVGALGLVGDAGMLVDLPAETLSAVPETYVADDGNWVGITGRARVVVYDSEQVSEGEAPDTAEAILDPQWAGEVGVAPGNASFLAFVTALRITEGEDGAAQWLETLAGNGVQTYERNGDILEAVNNGEVKLGLINHYYWFAAAAEQGSDMRAQLKFGASGDVAGLVNATGVGILTGGEGRSDAQAFIDYLLSEEGQTYFVEETYEYPLVPGITGPEGVPPLESLGGPDIDLSDLGTVDVSAGLVDAAGISVG